MEKRRAPRYEISLEALVHPSEGRSWLCLIQDFCIGGMLLVEQESTRVRRTAPVGQPGEQVRIHFSVPALEGEKHVRLTGNIVRIAQDGLGISIEEGIDDSIMDLMTVYSRNLQEAEARQKERTARKASAREGSAATKKKTAKERTTAREKAIRAAKAKAAQKKRQSARPDLKDASARPAPGKEELSQEAKKAVGKEPKAAASVVSVDEASPQEAEDATAIEEAEGAEGISARDAKNIIAQCRKRTISVLGETNTALFIHMDQELLRLAGSARDSTLQSEFFAALSALADNKVRLDQKIADAVLDQIDDPKGVDEVLSNRQTIESKRQAQESEKTKIALVNPDEFEDWLTVANIISRAESASEEELNQIRTRMGMLVESWSHRGVNPFCPEVFTRAFDDAFRDVRFTKAVREKLYEGYENVAAPLFKNYYASLAELLEESGVFPGLDEHFFTPGVPKKSESDAEIPGEAPPPPEVEEEAVAEVEEDPEQFVLNDDLEDPDEPATRVSASGPAQAPASAPTPTPASAPAPTKVRGERQNRPRRPGDRRTASGEVGSVLRNLYSTVRTLMHPDEAPETATDNEQLTAEEVQNVLAELQSYSKVGTNRLPVRQQIRRRMEQEGMSGELSPMDNHNLEVIENLVDNIKKDELVSNSAKDWVRQLEITLSRIATESPDFLDVNNPHVAVDVVNQLAQLGTTGSSAIQRSVDRIVQHIVESYDGNDEIFTEALDDLQPLVERQSRVFKGNVQRAVTVSKGQQTLINSQQAVIGELDRRYSGRQVPEMILKFLVPGWRNLLVNTHLRQGDKSADWRRNLHILDQLFLHLDENADPTQSRAYMEPEVLLRQIEAGLDAISYEPGQKVPLLGALKQLLAEDADLAGIKRVTMPEDGLADSLGFGDIKAKEQSRIQIRREFESNSEWQAWFDRCRNLFVGEWLEFVNEAREAEIAIVAWISDERDNFVFVNRRGIQTHELVIEELTSKLMSGEAVVVSESDLPMTDRASRRMLQNMHNQLTHQATHDELTGLANRKEFERNLDIALKKVKKEDGTDVVALLNLDQFKVINNVSGHDAGDEVLGSIAGLLTSNITDESCLLARLGGDEFGIHLGGYNETRTLAILETVQEEIRTYRFDLSGTQYSLTSSIGCVVVDKGTESVLHIMRAADSACTAAKDAGRDRIQLFEQGDDDLVRRTDIMAFVVQIDQALESDRFVLNYQEIAPINQVDDGLPHYEILLTVLNEAGEPLPPQDFIVAAETYNRMGIIDRWVIEKSFRWIADNYDNPDSIPGFSVNISGNSLNDDGFMDFILKQFDDTGVPSSKICFEITETAAVANLEGAIEFMSKMKVIGCEFSLDDFGTGLSSFSYLRNLPVDYLKIDGMFVRDIVDNPNDLAVVTSINEIGHFMGMKTIAEFVEDEAILELLRDIGVDYGQGYGIGPKTPLEKLV